MMQAAPSQQQQAARLPPRAPATVAAGSSKAVVPPQQSGTGNSTAQDGQLTMEQLPHDVRYAVDALKSVAAVMRSQLQASQLAIAQETATAQSLHTEQLQHQSLAQVGQLLAEMNKQMRNWNKVHYHAVITMQFGFCQACPSF
jgi:hypothetical protein